MIGLVVLRGRVHRGHRQRLDLRRVRRGTRAPRLGRRAGLRGVPLLHDPGPPPRHAVCSTRYGRVPVLRVTFAMAAVGLAHGHLRPAVAGLRRHRRVGRRGLAGLPGRHERLRRRRRRAPPPACRSWPRSATRPSSPARPLLGFLGDHFTVLALAVLGWPSPWSMARRARCRPSELTRQVRGRPRLEHEAVEPRLPRPQRHARGRAPPTPAVTRGAGHGCPCRPPSAWALCAQGEHGAGSGTSVPPPPR